MKKTITDTKIWLYILGIAALVIVIMKLDLIVDFLWMLWNACSILVFGAMLAYIINLILKRVEKGIEKIPVIRKQKRGISLLISLAIIILIFYAMITLVVPSLIEAGTVLAKVLPGYFQQIQNFLVDLFEKYPEVVKTIQHVEIDWKNLLDQAWAIFTSGLSSIVGTTINLVTVVINSVVNIFLMIIVAIYFLLEKERFVRLYHRLTNLYLKPKVKQLIDHTLKVFDQSFGAFICGQCLEAAILGSLCALGMTILHMPYPLMIGTLVGVINIIPMIGAYIGGAIGVFMVFTVNPITAIWFLIYLCILQQIESNLIYPRVVGSSVGLPGVYVMMTVIVFGSLAGILGMLFGIPIMASIYRLSKEYVAYAEKQKLCETQEI